MDYIEDGETKDRVLHYIIGIYRFNSMRAHEFNNNVIVVTRLI